MYLKCFHSNKKTYPLKGDKTMTSKDLYLSWLNDAYSMEKNVEQMLSQHASQASDHPQIQSKLEEHLRITQSQADRVKGCIERNGGSVSSVKSGISSMMGAISGMSSGVFSDALIKNCLAEYATEHFEIASYTSLLQAAERLNDPLTARICQDIIREEEEMAHWLEDNLPQVSNSMLQSAT
jgi:ferritin-like metal-binding protein YciE